MIPSILLPKPYVSFTPLIYLISSLFRPDPSLWKSLLFRAHHQSTPNALVAFVASQSWDCSSSSSPRLSGTNGLDSRHRATLIRLALGHQVDRPDTQFPLSSYHRLPRCRAQPAHLGAMVVVSGFNVGYLSPPRTTGKEGHTDAILGPFPGHSDSTRRREGFLSHTAEAEGPPYCTTAVGGQTTFPRDPLIAGGRTALHRAKDAMRVVYPRSRGAAPLSAAGGMRALPGMRYAIGEGSPPSVVGKELAGGGGNMAILGRRRHAWGPLDFGRVFDGLKPSKAREGLLSEGCDEDDFSTKLSRWRRAKGGSQIEPPEASAGPLGLQTISRGCRTAGGTRALPQAKGATRNFQRIFDEAEPPEAREGRPLDGLKPEACLGTRGVRKMTRRSRVASDTRVPFALVMRLG
ncbi:uncharacterized protein SCHCODRAFT_02517386 [Schizophyllum commune H4-8]|uniref:uncharacterized protein n=1 Tax=Schizophyllum commune (strain H4-8 / FGSC 9210) TaxID=578458 RepID=UPI0021600BF9|nr:uncharacterized protein SCHCODRAFT_02517386 [Schizophyllum commune H4-8]KAI5886267.1 hypothetical protein SCHCODRAFT_02517386 [Schizophyllum commune H4-8]